MIFGIMIIAMTIAGYWQIFWKADESGWKCLIPVYNLYIQFKICWDIKFFWVMLGCSIISGILMSSGFFILLVNGLIFGLAGLVLEMISIYRLSRAFGHGIGYALGLIFLFPIFLMIIGFGESSYDYAYNASPGSDYDAEDTAL